MSKRNKMERPNGFKITEVAQYTVDFWITLPQFRKQTRSNKNSYPLFSS